MRIVAQHPSGTAGHEIVSRGPSDTLGDLAVAVGLGADLNTVWLDGETLPTSVPLREVSLVPGTVIAHPDVAIPLLAQAESVNTNELGIAGGWDASHRLPLAAGAQVIGPPKDPTGGPIAPGTVTSQRFAIDTAGPSASVITVDPTSVEVNGRTQTIEQDFNDGIVVTNRTGFTFLPPQASAVSRLAEPSRGGPTLFNRPPRTVPDAEADPVDLPKRPEKAEQARKLSIAMMLAPIPIGILMVIAFRSWIFAIFILMTPIMALGRWIEGKRNAKRDGIRFAAEMKLAMAHSAHVLDRARTAEQQRRRRVQPDVAELRRRAEIGAPTLWERQMNDPDYLTVSLGWADQEWEAADFDDTADFPELAALLATLPPLEAVPMAVDIDTALGLGIVGPRSAALSLARSVVLQAVTASGPADLELLVITERDRLADWEWIKWLPHLTGTGGRPRVATTTSAAAAELEDLLNVDDRAMNKWATNGDERTDPVRLIVVDHDDAATTAASPVRAALRPDISARAVILTGRPDLLPRACGAVVTIESDGLLTLHHPATNITIERGLPAGVTADSAHEWARAMARFADPNSGGANAAIPRSITLRSLRDARELSDPAALLDLWKAAPVDPHPAAVIGTAAMGALDIDLVRDGPHGLIAGTTGSGKSELLRTMVTAMAANASPDHLNFVLIDFKGGGAFDLCGELPHVVSVVTDLDEHLASRALRCLSAELKFRETELRNVGASDIREYLERSDKALPRLVVIIDEFATLVAELPDFLNSLVDIAQRGRSLGVHLILATQRPSGVVDRKIKANTNLRIALRVQDGEDSDDVIGTREAAMLGRDQAGRAFARFGSSEIVEFQTAIVSIGSRSESEQRLEVDEFTLLAAATPREVVFEIDATTDAELYTKAIVAATELGGYQPPRVPWPDPLPSSLKLESVVDSAIHPVTTPIGLADLPEEQRQEVEWWTPGRGNTLFYGASTDCLSRSVMAMTLGLAKRSLVDDLHLYVLDYGNRALADLGQLPHCGAYVGLGDTERTDRLIDLLTVELQRRRSQRQSGDESPPTTMLLIDNYAALLESFEERGDHEAQIRLASIVRDGPGLGVFTFATAVTERGIPLRVASAIESKLVFRMADQTAYMVFGLTPRDVPEMGPMRAMDALTGREVQIYDVQDVNAAVRAVSMVAGDPHRRPPPVRVLEAEINHRSLYLADATMSADEWRLPIGVAASNLGTEGLVLPSSEHAVIAGPPRSGRTTTLATIAATIASVSSETRIVGLVPRNNVLRNDPTMSTVLDNTATPEELQQILDAPGPLVLLIDDVETVGAELVAVLEASLNERRDDRHIIAAGRTDTFRNHASWTRQLRDSRSGVVLGPAPSDGDIFKTQLPLRRQEAYPPGRGFIVNQGLPTLAQVAVPTANHFDGKCRPNHPNVSHRGEVN